MKKKLHLMFLLVIGFHSLMALGLPRNGERPGRSDRLYSYIEPIVCADCGDFVLSISVRNSLTNAEEKLYEPRLLIENGQNYVIARDHDSAEFRISITPDQAQTLRDLARRSTGVVFCTRLDVVRCLRHFLQITDPAIPNS